jgi:hypothetical protein
MPNQSMGRWILLAVCLIDYHETFWAYTGTLGFKCLWPHCHMGLTVTTHTFLSGHMGWII